MQATVYQLTDQPERARRILNRASQIDPSHTRASALAEADTFGRVAHSNDSFVLGRPVPLFR